MTPLPWAGVTRLAELGDRLLGASLAAVVILGAALLLARILPASRPRLRALVLWLGLARALAELAGVPAFELAWRAPVAPVASLRFLEIDLRESVANSPATRPTQPAPTSTAAAPVPAPGLPWSGALLMGVAGFWLAGLTVAALALAGSLWRLRKTVRAARRLDPESLAGCGLNLRPTGRRPIEIAVSEEIGTPQAVGLLRPRILLPERALALPAEQLELALLHERVHVERRDALLALVPALAERLFFFHPLVRRATREFGLAIEAACDAEVLRRSGAAPERYGWLLLRMATAPSLSGRLATAWPLARSPLARRLEMLSRTTLSPARRMAAVLTFGAALVLAVPVRLVATQPVGAVAPVAAPVPPAPAARVDAVAPLPPTPAALPVPAVARTRGDAPPPAPPTPAHSPAPPAPPAAPILGDLLESLGIDRLVFLADGSRYSFASGPAGGARAEALRRAGEPLVWFVRDGQEWVVRDQAWLTKLRERLDGDHTILEASLRAARDQAKLARDTARVAARAARASARESRRAGQAASREMERVAARGEALTLHEHTALEDEIEGEVHRHLAKVEAELERSHAQLEAQGAEIERWSAEIEARVEEGVRQQQRALRELLEEALDEGLAVPVP